MNTRTFLWAAIMGAAPALAAGQSFVVTPEAIKISWQVAGAGPNDIKPDGQGWILPAGAQVSRMFASTGGASEVAVAFTGRPHFDAAAANMPTLEFGNALVAFARSGDDGALVVLIGENEPVVLPFAFPLEETGRSAEPLQLRLRFDPFNKRFSVDVGDQTLTIPGEPGHGGLPATLALSAGGNEPLVVDSLQITLSEPATVAPDATAGGVNNGSEDAAAGPNQATARASAQAAIGSGVSGGEATATPNVRTGAEAKAPTSSTLEIYTPMSGYRRLEALRRAERKLQP